MRRLLGIVLLAVLSLAWPVGMVNAGYYHHGHHSGYFWAPFGFGLLTGAVISTIYYRAPRETVVYYQTPPPMIVYPDPVMVQQYPPPPSPYPQLVLRRVQTTPAMLNIRSNPDTAAPIADQVPRNTTVDVLGAAAEWLYIRTQSGRYGWIMTRYTREVEGPAG